MTDTQLKLALPDGREVSALWQDANTSSQGWAFVYAPGASSGLNDGFGAYAAAVLASKGVSSLRFQFPYVEAGRGGPDRPPVLEATWRAAIAAAKQRVPRLVAGGRSMGGRMASHVVAQGEPVGALALFAYPLHPTGRPEQRRDAHLASIMVPSLFCSGDRDTFATVEELRELVAGLRTSRLHILAGADHGFQVLKSSGRSRQDVWQEAVDALVSFVGEVRE
jgi:predicted alpha/beta-hydrolase family hydrolase